jgi:hypothetical protein
LPQVDMECNESVDKWLNEWNKFDKIIHISPIK